MTSVRNRFLCLFVSLALGVALLPSVALASVIPSDPEGVPPTTVTGPEVPPGSSDDEGTDEDGDSADQETTTDDTEETFGIKDVKDNEPEVSYEAQAVRPPSIETRLDNNESIFCVSARGGHFDNTNRVKIAVWSDDKGQDDLRWYDVPRMSDGSWAMNAPIANHKSTGLYNVHAYAFDGSKFIFAGGSSFNVSTPRASNVRFFQLSEANGSFTVYVDDIKGASVRSVRVAVWADMGGQDDLHWYNTVVRGNSYTFGAYMMQHKAQTGTYIADVYVTLSSGLDVCIKRVSANLKISGGSLSYRNDGDRSVTVSCRDGLYGMASGVQYAVWSAEGGQDDLRWYRATRMPDTSWPVAIPISNHRTAGTYYVHVYGDFSGGQTFIGATSFYIKPNSAASVVTFNHNNTLGSFLVRISGINAPTGISKVEVPTWTQANQGDVRWYQASRQSNGDYLLCVNASNHYLANNYNIHVYVTSGNGIRNYVGQASGNKLNLDHFASVEGNAGSGYRTVWIKNPPSSNVDVYVWSSTGGQDDIAGYKASYVGGGAWKATIDCGKLKHSGMVNVHIYSGGKAYKCLYFNVSQSDLVPPVEQAMNNRVNGLSSRTGWLIGVDTSNCFVTVYNGSQGNWHAVRTFPCAPGKWSTPSKKGVYSVGIKGYVFGSGYSCYYYTQYSGNYLFHSILYNPGTFNVQDGTMGTPASHGCIRLWLENAKFIYDSVPGGSTVLVY